MKSLFHIRNYGECLSLQEEIIGKKYSQKDQTDIAKEFAVLAEVEDDLWEQFDDVEKGVLEIKDIITKKFSIKIIIA